jgi:hypothetical protein
MALYSLQTELGAVNSMLASISSSAVDRLEGDDVPIDAASAHTLLLDTMRAFQDSAEDWIWNTETFDLPPDVPTGFINLPLNTLKAFPWDNRYVLRGTRLYDTVDHTFVIGATAKVTLRLLLPFDQMPNAAREYVARKAKRLFQGDEQGDAATIRQPDRDELMAYAAVLNDNAEALQANVTTGWRSVRYGYGYGDLGAR